jgi:hypothetical protein
MAFDEGSFRLASSKERARLDVWRLGRTGPWPRKAARGDTSHSTRRATGNAFKAPYHPSNGLGKGGRGEGGKGGMGKFNKTYRVTGDSGIQETANQAINHLLYSWQLRR